MVNAQRDYLARLAMVDLLTGGPNRTAYEQDTKNLDQAQDIFVVQVDVNGLKEINDRYGHAVGDEAIKRTYTCMADSLKEMGKCYRTGGDEFICILSGIDKDELIVLLQTVADHATRVNEEVNFPFSFAVGVAYCGKDGEKTLADACRKADERMYQSKVRYKASGEIQVFAQDN